MNPNGCRTFNLTELTRTVWLIMQSLNNHVFPPLSAATVSEKTPQLLRVLALYITFLTSTASLIKFASDPIHLRQFESFLGAALQNFGLLSQI